MNWIITLFAYAYILMMVAGNIHAYINLMKFDRKTAFIDAVLTPMIVVVIPMIIVGSIYGVIAAAVTLAFIDAAWKWSAFFKSKITLRMMEKDLL